ncbi:hypothetical protein HU830_08545 [Lactobacillus sp. DCY120]|uniref:Uncharacterized protein n=1 Tax=Bombilactobacillus apium TaxID=2675299 RepID=A0A850R8J4_9LACO|nr:LVIS_2131 family protein [Bombilactobacillus apium]NVY97167.1 hypothetical protein [Bombilactobacillus apium]
MNLNWNLLGFLIWLLFVIAVGALIVNIRHRHLKMVVVQRQHHSWLNLSLDFGLSGIMLLVFGGLFYLTFLQPVTVTNSQQVKLSYKLRPLVMQTENAQGFYVEAHEASDKSIIKYYTYWTRGAKYNVPGNNASISDGKQPISLNAKNYPWPDVTHYDQKYQSAYALTLVAHYRNNWRNGLGFRAGTVATDYTVIRVPSSTFTKITK